MEEYAREPCPFRIIDDCGGAFAMGCIGGGVFQAVKGFRNAPSGFNKRIVGSLTAVKIRSPVIAGNFAVWGGIPAMAGSAIIGGVLLTLIEGVGILFTRLSAEQFRNPTPPTEDPMALEGTSKSFGVDHTSHHQTYYQ
ncbi:mitochondrial import inner membrane translocase subunit Tim17-B isoform X2 [Eurosta solidaginis]|uniref:mitochondrial import inner membrane translocase subunit Tim17-B isoform X2 n=1 Tax=Eurosta solidaginis TaxID=178769 RepID=UPI0035316B99